MGLCVQQWAPDRPLCLGTTRTNWAPRWEPWERLGRVDSTVELMLWGLELYSSLLVSSYTPASASATDSHVFCSWLGTCVNLLHTLTFPFSKQTLVAFFLMLASSSFSSHRSQCCSCSTGRAPAAAQCPGILTVRRLAALQKPAVRPQEEGGGESIRGCWNSSPVLLL